MDLSGQPSGLVIGETVLGSSEISAESYAWVSARFAVMPKVNAGQRYWLVLARGGTFSTQHYHLAGVDESLAYAEGALRVYNQVAGAWEACSPDADLLFRLNVLQGRLDRLGDIFAAGGQFLAGLTCESDPGLHFAGGEDAFSCLCAFREQLKMGTAGLRPLLAEVTRQRVLRVFEQDSPGERTCRMDEAGRLLDLWGYVMEEPGRAVGRWVRAMDDGEFFARRVSLDAESGVVRFES